MKSGDFLNAIYHTPRVVPWFRVTRPPKWASNLAVQDDDVCYWDGSTIHLPRLDLNVGLEASYLTFLTYAAPDTHPWQVNYLASKGVRCVNCDGKNLEGGPVEIEASMAFQDIRCYDCDTTWTDEYTLTGFSQLEAPD